MFLYEILWIFVGMVVNTIFQAPISKVYSKFREVVSRVFPEKGEKNIGERAFIIGKRVTNAVIIEGDGYSSFKDIRAHIQEELPDVLPQEILDYRKKSVEKLEERNASTWHEENLSLYKYNVIRTGNVDDSTIEIFLTPKDFYEVYSTIDNLNSGKPSLREKYIETFSFESNATYPLPNAIGICLCAITKESKIIFVTRSTEVAFRPNENDVSVVKRLMRADIEQKPLDLSNVCYRAACEEIGDMSKDKVDVSVLGLVFDKEYNQWNLIGCVCVDMTQDELISRRNSGVLGKWQSKNLDFISFNPKDVFQYLSTHKIWDMGIVATYFTLVYKGYSKERLDKFIEKYLR